MGFELTTIVVIGIDCIGSCKFNYHTITTMVMAPFGFPNGLILFYTGTLSIALVKFCLSFRKSKTQVIARRKISILHIVFDHMTMYMYPIM